MTKEKTAVVLRPNSARMSAGQMKAFAEALERFGASSVSITGDQRLIVAGLRPEELDAARTGLMGALGIAEDIPGVHGGVMVKACPGSAGCKNGLGDTLALAERIEKLLSTLDLPAKVRVGLSGCPRGCGESYVRDIGLMARPGGWTLIFGGNAGGRPRIGDEIAAKLSDDQALDLLSRLLFHYCAHAKKNQRSARFVEAHGIEVIKEALGLADQAD